MDFVPRTNGSKPDSVNVPLLDGMLYEMPQPDDLEGYLKQAEEEADSPSSATEIAFYIQSRFFFGLLAKYLEVQPRVEDYVKEVDGHFGLFICLDKLANSFFGEGERYFLYEGNLSLKDLRRTRLQVLRLERLPNGHRSPVPEVALSALVLCDAFAALFLDEDERQSFPRDTGREMIINDPLQEPYRHTNY